jgi:hypothetical protein
MAGTPATGLHGGEGTIEQTGLERDGPCTSIDGSKLKIDTVIATHLSAISNLVALFSVPCTAVLEPAIQEP